ncbi:hypothetical protein GCM10023263_63680 [Phytohabitans rumicis]
MSRPGYYLYRPVGWDTNLHRPARSAARQLLQQLPDRLSEGGGIGGTAGVEVAQNRP